MKSENISYTDGDKKFESVLVTENETEKRPAVLIFPAWNGRDDFVIEKAKDLSALGYVGVALDMYGNAEVGKSIDKNKALMAPLMEDRELLKKRALAGLEMVKKHSAVDSNKIAAIGFCFGGLCALDLARSGVDIRAVVSFHGLFTPPPSASSIKAKVLALHGYDDPMVPPEAMVEFSKEMTELKADWQVHVYGNTMHAFTNPKADDATMGTVYSPIAEKRAFHAMVDFFKEVFS